jgi:transcription initiation factor TFIIIB Brf1 subunit/transcription initiation factor TFIIB
MKCECGSTSLHHDRVRGEMVCRECGLVVEENMPACEARYVRFTSLDHSGPLAFSTQNPVNSVRVKTHGERRLEEVYHLIRHKQVTQDVKDRAMWVAKKYLRREGVLPIHSIEDFVEAIVYLVSRERGLAYKPSAPMRTVLRVKKGLVLAGVPVWGRKTEPEYYLNRIAPQLGLGQGARTRCLELLTGINRFTPATRAAASVALALEEEEGKPDIKEIAGYAGISTSTLWKALKALKEERGGAWGEVEERVAKPAPVVAVEEDSQSADPCHYLKRLIGIFRGK